MDNKQIPLAPEALNRLTFLDMPYEDILVDYTCTRVSAGNTSQTFVLNEELDYTIWQKGAKEAAPNTGMPSGVVRDYLMVSSYKEGAAFLPSKSDENFEIQGIGLVLNLPFVQTSAEGDTILSGEFGIGSDVAFNTERHASNFAHMFLDQTYIQVGGGDEDDCTGLGGLTKFCIMGGVDLSDADYAPHMGNNVVTNERRWASALLNKSTVVKAGDNPTITIKRSQKLRLTYHTAANSLDAQGRVLPDELTTHVRMIVTVVALGQKVPVQG